MREQLKYFISRNKLVSWLLTVLLAFVLGWIFSGGEGHEHATGPAASGTGQAEVWTCSMHPQVRQPGPGKCPICGMDLIPAKAENRDQNQPGQIELSEYARRLADIRVAPVERQFVSKMIRMVGKIDYDESRLRYITARVPGRIDRMYVDYTGVPVRAGDHLVELYSPDLVSTQQELIQTKQSLAKTGSEQIRQNLESVRERLRLWGMTAAQIEQIEKTGIVADHMTIYAPISGVVILKEGVEGAYVETGSRIYTLADLTRVWVMIDAYESDIAWLRYGQRVRFETEAYPGEKFDGKIAFIDPVLNENTRTVRLRVNVENNDGRLKPGMFVSAAVESQVAAGGKVIDEKISGKYICPMHPEIIKGGPGTCDVCGMSLVKTQSLGYVRPEDVQNEASLVIPATAPLITGKRAIVYVSLPGDRGRFEGREIVLGPRVGDYYVVLEGLQEGEQVVVNGSFKIDSAIQIMTGPSMMNPRTDQPPVSEPAAEMMPAIPPHRVGIEMPVREAFNKIYTYYFELQNALSHDNQAQAVVQSRAIRNMAETIPQPELDNSLKKVWISKMEQLKKGAGMILESGDIEISRVGFEQVSAALITLSRYFDADFGQPVYLYFCPMAFDNRGAEWLQNKEGTENPYFGSSMFSCGTQREILSGSLKKTAGGHQHD